MSFELIFVRESVIRKLFLHRTCPAVWYNQSPLWETIDGPAGYIRYIRALCSERTSNHSNEHGNWNHSTVMESTAGFQDKWKQQFHLSSSFMVFVSLFLLRCCITEEVLTANKESQSWEQCLCVRMFTIVYVRPLCVCAILFLYICSSGSAALTCTPSKLKTRHKCDPCWFRIK